MSRIVVFIDELCEGSRGHFGIREVFVGKT